MTLDVLYIVREGDSNDELRFSLRSLANLPHARVAVAGYCPSWLSADVLRIPRPQPEATKYHRAKATLAAGLAFPDLSPDVILMNDDFYVCAPVASVPVVHRGPITDVLVEYRGVSSTYTAGMRATRSRLRELGHPNPLSYELHLPLVVNRARLAAILSAPWYTPFLQERSLYGNLEGLGGSRVGDVKVEEGRRHPPPSVDPALPFLSSADRSFPFVAPLLHSLFPARSPYERRSSFPGSVPAHCISA